MAKEIYYCGCCGREHPGRHEHFCDDCLQHVDRNIDKYPWDRTYYAQHKQSYPHQVPELEVTSVTEYLQALVKNAEV